MEKLSFPHFPSGWSIAYVCWSHTHTTLGTQMSPERCIIYSQQMNMDHIDTISEPGLYSSLVKFNCSCHFTCNFLLKCDKSGKFFIGTRLYECVTLTLLFLRLWGLWTICFTWNVILSPVQWERWNRAVSKLPFGSLSSGSRLWILSLHLFLLSQC